MPVLVGRASARAAAGHAVVGGENYGQGSSREHAALAPRYLGLRVVIAKSFARIHWQNLINFGVLPVTLDDADQYAQLKIGDQLYLDGLQYLERNHVFSIRNLTNSQTIQLRHDMSSRQCDTVRSGGLINWNRQSVG